MNGKAIIVLASLLTYCPALAARPKTVGYLPVKPLTVALQATYALARGRAATETFVDDTGSPPNTGSTFAGWWRWTIDSLTAKWRTTC